jgi:glyoxylase-like metal-dependent hydrolase (beta-lactamase superfamily II)
MYSYFILGVAVALFLYIILHFHPVKTQKIDNNIYAVRCLFVNFYVYKTSNSTILFDCGFNELLVKNGLRKFNILPEEITDIFLTHSDFDHVGGTTLFKNANIYISEKEEPMINGKKARRFIVHNRKLSKYKTLKNEEALNINGIEIKLIETPGHTDGSASYLINNSYLITGDLLYLTRNKLIKPFLYINNMDHRQDKESIKNIRNIIGNSEYILTGHSGIKKMK